MTIGIYSITHITSGKRYIGKSKNIERRLISHKCSLRKKTLSKRIVNRYLYSAVQKYGWESFTTEILESFKKLNEKSIAKRELYWMDVYKTYDGNHGYNLRRDSSTGMIVHPETALLISKAVTGNRNPNYNNRWTEKMKKRMSKIKKNQHAENGTYNKEWKKKLSLSSKKTWENMDLRKQMANKVSLIKQKYNFLQYTRAGVFVRKWTSVKEIIKKNPLYKWQNIYAVCNGYKPTYMNFIWVKEPK